MTTHLNCPHCKGKGCQPGDPEGAPLEACLYCGGSGNQGVEPLKCMRCNTTDAVEMRPSYTAYHWNGEGENPNADVPLCPECFEEHREYWNEMWSYARGGY